jgi:hypothetical protein
MDRILLIGEQPSLLTTRAEILAKTGACVTCCDMSQLDSLLWDRSFDLVILCHTLLEASVRRSCLIADVYRHWPQAGVLQVVRGYGDQAAETGLDTNFLMWREPGELVNAAVKLLGKPPQAEWISAFEDIATGYAA